MIAALNARGPGLSLAADTRSGAYLEGSLPRDVLSHEGIVAFDVIDRGDDGTEVLASSEIKGQMFAWGKGTRALNAVLDAAEALVRRH